MTDVPDLRDAVRLELALRGHASAEWGDHLGLVTAGVNSATLIHVLSALEDAYDVDVDVERLFGGPLTVDAIATGIALAMEKR